MKTDRWVGGLSIALLTFSLSFGPAACASGELEDGVVDENQQNDGDDQNDNDKNDNQTEPDGELSEAQQLCAAAAESTDGELTALHCFGPHDVSGFEASDGERTWQPGAFNVVAQ